MSFINVKCLSDGHKIPVLGLGTYLSGGQPVAWALKNGYRLIDTASLYDNEEDVGRSVRESGVPREDMFVVTKLWNTDHGREATQTAFQQSLKRLGLEYVDLYLMHSVGGGKVLETWDTMLELKKLGLVKSVGVANFNANHLSKLKKARPDDVPVVNQIEIHPFLNWQDCVTYCEKEGIAVMAYSPLAKAEKLKNKTLLDIASKYGKSAAQVMIRWSVQKGFVCIPKSAKEERIVENMDVFDFILSESDMDRLNGLDEHYITDWPGIMNHPWQP